MRSLRLVILGFVILLLLFIPPVTTRPTALLHQADSAVSQREYASALRQYDDLFGWVEPAILHVRIGNVNLQKRQLDDAKTHFKQALALAPRDADALLGLGIVALEQNHYPEAIKRLEGAVAIRPNEPQINYQLGIAYLQSLDFERARAAFNRALSAETRDGQLKAAINYYLGLTYLGQDLNAARSYFAKAQEDSDKESPAPSDTFGTSVEYRKGLARLMQGIIEELGATPNDEAYLAARLGHGLLEAGETRLATFYLEKAVKLRPDYAEAKAYLGYAYWSEGRQQEALETLRDAVQLDRSNSLGHYFLGVALRSQHQLAESIDEFREAIRLDSKNAEARVELARTLVLQARYAEAGEEFAEAMRLQPEDVELKLVAVWFHLDHLFDVETGLKIAREAERIAPTDADVEDGIGWALYVNGKVDEADAALRKAVQSAPFSAKVHYHLGVLLEERGDVEGAKKEYERSIDLDVEGSIASKARRAMESVQWKSQPSP